MEVPPNLGANYTLKFRQMYGISRAERCVIYPLY